MMRSFTSTLAWLLALAVGGCGGGGSTTAPDTPPLNRAPVAVIAPVSAASVGVALTLDASASRDPDGDALTHEWRVSSAPAGASPSLGDPATARPTFVADQPGSYTLTLVVRDASLSASTAVTIVAQAAGGGPLSIAIDQPEPVSGVVVLSLSAPHDGGVDWYLDLQPLGTTVSGRDLAPMSWNSAAVAPGPHLVIARLLDGQGGWQEIRRSIEVGFAPVSVVARVRGTTGTIEVDVAASSPHGIRSVSATLDGQDLGTLTERNGCGPYTLQGCFGPPFSGWLFSLQAGAIGPGSHTMRITAVDNAERTRTIEQELRVGPIIALDWPRDGAVVHGVLPITGQVRGEPPAGVQVSVLLGGTEVLASVGPDIAGSFDLAGVVPNRYLLTVKATDGSGLVTQEQHRIAVAPSANWVFAPSLSIYPGQLLAARGALVLHDTEGLQLRMADLLGGAPVALELDGPWHPQLGHWQMGDGLVYASGNTGDCSGRCLYRWDRNGRRSNLTAANPFSVDKITPGASAADESVAARGSVVLVRSRAGSGRDRLVLHDSATGGFALVADTADQGLADLQADLTLEGGVARVVFGGAVAGAPPARYALREWRSDTGASRLLAEAGGAVGNLRTDGSRVFFVHWPAADRAAGTGRLLALSPDTGSTQTLVSPFAGSAFELQEDGSLSWGESLLAGSVVHTLPPPDAGGQRTVFAAGHGWIFYIQASNNMLYAWNAATGTTEPVFDAHARRGYVTGEHLVFQYLGAVYRIPLRR